MEVLDLLRLSHFDGTNWSLKLDKHTEEGRFGSAGDKNITTALYKICKYYIQLVLRSDNQKSYKTIEGKVHTVKLCNCHVSTYVVIFMIPQSYH